MRLTGSFLYRRVRFVAVQLIDFDGLTDADSLSSRPITWRRTAEHGILAIALMIATPSLEAAYERMARS
jgi:hypothetical protein